ncbi:hypothetical protein Xekk_02590 [Xenorhabdus sp. KK7.4]|nr:hypothetical protein Xekk_02590 [Xenorhabdus sp. KK7.4]
MLIAYPHLNFYICVIEVILLIKKIIKNINFQPLTKSSKLLRR